MKRILLLCAFFMGSLVFACDSPLHEMFHEVTQLKSEGYHYEAADLLSDITRADICNFSAGEMRCYNSASRDLNFTGASWVCNGCNKMYGYRPTKCDRCSSTSFTFWGV